MMELYDWKTWPGFFPVEFNPIPEREMAVVFEESNLRVFASPVRHLIPTIGLRIEVIATGKVLAYSCDTEPCPETVRLAHRADFLVHEATGEAQGHSSGSQAAEIAQESGAKSLYLIHYPTGDFNAQALVEAAQQKYPNPVFLARDFLELNL
jgi:ribonuclease Z